MTTTPLLPPSTRSPGQERHGATSTSADGGSGTCRSGHSSPAQCRTRSTCCRGWSPRAIFERSTPCARSTSAARALFDEPRLQQWLGRYATYSGSTPAPRAGHVVVHTARRSRAWLLVSNGWAWRTLRCARARCWQGWCRHSDFVRCRTHQRRRHQRDGNSTRRWFRGRC